MNTESRKVKITFECSEGFRAKLKIESAMRKTTMAEYIISRINQAEDEVPNLETRNAMMDCLVDRGLSSAETLEEFWTKMGTNASA